MAVSYNKLWKLLIDKKISKAELRRMTGISPNTMTKLNRDEEVTLSVLSKICELSLIHIWLGGRSPPLSKTAWSR